MSIPKEQVSRALVGKLYEMLTAQPDIDAEDLPDDRFVAWCMPGLPYEPGDFDFAIRGIGASGSSDDDSTSAGEDVRQRIIFASDWARMANFVPNAQGIYDDEQRRKMADTDAFAQDGSSILSVYRNVLDFSEVTASELTESQRERLERFRGQLTETREEEDLITGEMREVVDDSQLVKRYQQREQEYIDAAMEYSSKRLNALNSDDAAAVQDWALNGELYRNRVRSAYNSWVNTGFKNEVEQMSAFIDQVSRRNLVLLKARLLDDIEKTRQNDPSSGQSFHWTSIIPARFAHAEGWTEYTFSHEEVTEHERSRTNQWEVDARVPISSWLVRGEGERSYERNDERIDTSEFSIEFEVTQAMISRPWFSPEFLFSNAWRFEENMPELTNLTERLSDGETPPNGSLIAYPTAAIFVRNVTLDFAELHNEESDFKRELEADGNLSIGFLRLASGGYERGTEQRDFESEVTNEGLRVPGMQLIGFKCKLLPELPNPSEEVEAWA